MQPKTDYTTAWDNSAFVLSPPVMPACVVGMAAMAVYKFPDYCKYFAYDEATVVAYLTKFGPGLYDLFKIFIVYYLCCASFFIFSTFLHEQNWSGYRRVHIFHFFT